MANYNKVMVKEMVTKDGEFPIVKVEILDNKDTVIDTGYLSPFRGYCFQVSETKEGENDMGASSVIGLGHVLDVHYVRSSKSIYSSNKSIDGVIEELLLGQAIIALTHNWSKQAAIVAANNLRLTYLTEITPMGVFIRECRKYLQQRV